MAASGSTRVVVLALLANLGIAVAKLVAAVSPGSGSMLAESVHSFADSGNQGLLLPGHSRAQLAPNKSHPLGYGRESDFWALLVAAILFVLGGVFSLYEAIWGRHGYEVLGLYAIWDGPARLLVPTKVRPGDRSLDVSTLMRQLNEVENEVRAAYPQVAYHFVEPDFLV